MKLNELIERDEEKGISFSVNNKDRDDGVLEQLDKMFIYSLAAGKLENDFMLPRLSDCSNLNVSRGSLFMFYNLLSDRIDKYLGREADAKGEKSDPAAQLTHDYTVKLKYSEDFFKLVEKVFVEGIDMKYARTGKGEGKSPDGIYAEIDDVVKQTVALRFSKQKISDYFHDRMESVKFDAEERKFFAEATFAFQTNYKKSDYSEIVFAEGRGEGVIEGDNVKEDMLICDSFVPFYNELAEHEWNITCFSKENGLSYSNMNFESGATEYKKYDLIYCPDHTFSENLLSADAIFNFLLTAKNKLKENGRLIINAFEPDRYMIEQSQRRNRRTRFDLILSDDGTVIDRESGERSEKCSPETAKSVFSKALAELEKIDMKGDWDKKCVSLKKTIEFIHFDENCEKLKIGLGIDPGAERHADGSEIKIWSVMEDVKYSITTPSNAAEINGNKKTFAAYVEDQNYKNSKTVEKHNLLEYVLMDPTSLIDVLEKCGFEADIKRTSSYGYPTAGLSDKNLYYVCRVKKN